MTLRLDIFDFELCTVSCVRRSLMACVSLSFTCLGFFISVQFDVQGTQVRQISVNYDILLAALCFLLPLVINLGRIFTGEKSLEIIITVSLKIIIWKFFSIL